MEAADREGLQSGSSRLSTLMIDVHVPGDLVRSAMRAASQLSGRGPTDVDVAPIVGLYLHVNQKSDYDDDDDESHKNHDCEIITDTN